MAIGTCPRLRLLPGLLLMLWLTACVGSGAPLRPRLGAFEAAVDVGATAMAGATVFDRGAYRVSGGGAGFRDAADGFHFAWTRRSGDIHLVADIGWIEAGAGRQAKAGLMIRQSLQPGAPFAAAMLDRDGSAALHYRDVEGGPVREIRSNVIGARRLRLEREGDYVFFSVAAAGGVLRHAGGNYRIPFGGPVYAGLAVSAQDDAAAATASFAHVELAVPKLAHVPDTGYPAKVESSLEVMDLTGAEGRRIVRHFDGKIEAPNWSKDGRWLIYNSGGLLYRIPVGGGDPQAIDTGAQRNNNNDHGLSPDGTLLAISDQSQPDGHSRIYVLPVSGSANPNLVVSHPSAPSYWHGWSPDGRTLAFTATRPETGDYDIYARDLAGGAERRLTTARGLDDGPEYSPDGRYIYFNSARSGAMQIWRMRGSDGADPEQVTRDPAWRDWFPHVSPDGKWIVFVSFGLDVALEDHPPNRDVVLRLMPADGSAPPGILTKLFGGQGTINVPSWSPDGKAIAFVSYRLVR